MKSRSPNSKPTGPPAHVRNVPTTATLEGWGWHYRTLRALRDHLAGAAGDRLREPSGAMEPPSGHPEDWVDELYDRELVEALPKNRTEALCEVDAALARLSNGTYGVCEATGRPIPQSQLRANPWRRFVEDVTAS